MKLSVWVRTARKHGGLTQEELGERLAVTKSNVSGWENGRHAPSFAQISRIAAITGYSMPNQPPPAKAPADDVQSVTDSGLQLLDDLMYLPPAERETLFADIHRRAEQGRALVAEVVGKMKRGSS